jgi:phosphatidylserine/phosphatidylglycerophosphate/cardiolipin synthase-like enzyme
MAKFLNTSATNYFLEELIKQTNERLIMISPFLKFNDRIKELLTDKDRMKIDVRLVYGKSELAPQEINWLRSLEFLRTSFCQNLHAKCYLNEESAIITSMNLYDFSQVNNNEMGVYIRRDTDSDLYMDTYEEASRLIRVSDQVRLSAEQVTDDNPKHGTAHEAVKPVFEKLSTSKLAKALKLKTSELNHRLVSAGLLESHGDKLNLTEKGKRAGGESKISRRFGQYFVWPNDMTV